MRHYRFMETFLFLLMSAVVIVAPASASEEFWHGLVSDVSPPVFDDKEKKKLSDRRTLVRLENLKHPEKDKIRFFRTYVVVDHPAEKTWECLKQVEELYKYQPLMRLSKPVKDTDKYRFIQMQLHLYVGKISYVNRYETVDKRRVIFFNVDSSYKHDIRDAFGYWRIHEWTGNRTLLEYAHYVEPGRIIPQWLYDQLTRIDQPNIVRFARKRFESDCKWNQWED